MGRVYSGEKVFNGELPGKGDHKKAGLEILGGIREDKGALGAMVYGSTALGRTSLRSDVDILVAITGTGNHGEIIDLAHWFNKAEKKFGVVVEPNIIDYQSMQNPLRHSIDPLFYEELRKVSDSHHHFQWVAIESPVDMLKTFEPTERRIRNLGMVYAGAKGKQFTKALVTYKGKADLEILQRALELPSAIGRKAIPATDALGELDYDVTDKDHMQQLTLSRLKRLSEVSQSALHWQGSKDPPAVFSELIQWDDMYNRLLNAAVSGNVSLKEYEHWIEANYIRIVSLARASSYDWAELIRQTAFMDFDHDSIVYLEPGEEPPFDDEFDETPIDDLY